MRKERKSDFKPIKIIIETEKERGLLYQLTDGTKEEDKKICDIVNIKEKDTFHQLMIDLNQLLEV